MYDCRFVLDYYRLTADKRLLFGGGANYSGKDSRDIAGELRPCIERTFPALKGVPIEFQWSCAMGIVVNRIPQLGKLSENVWYCQGYSGHGIATSHIMGEIMAEALTGTLEKFDTFAACKHIKVPMGICWAIRCWRPGCGTTRCWKNYARALMGAGLPCSHAACSKSSGPQAIFFKPCFFSSSSRNSRRRILPTLVVGNASRNSM